MLFNAHQYYGIMGSRPQRNVRCSNDRSDETLLKPAACGGSLLHLLGLLTSWTISTWATRCWSSFSPRNLSFLGYPIFEQTHVVMLAHFNGKMDIRDPWPMRCLREMRRRPQASWSWCPRSLRQLDVNHVVVQIFEGHLHGTSLVLWIILAIRLPLFQGQGLQRW